MRRPVIRGLLLVLVLAVGFIAGQLSAAQPHMQAALKNLRQAKANLNSASADKGGHRNRALELVNQAIDQVEAGIAYDRRH
ncbi:MAG TPA: hypothetical protein VKB93_04350 [Thermoanaerobaculia bacterium]|nr:hypothetical protein [Thermoanaerobaculia bacterium]